MKLPRRLVGPFRSALAALPEVAAWETLTPPQLEEVFVPQQHPKALSLESSIVVGMRGAGKSFWTAVLASERHRAFLAALVKQPGLANVKTGVGFGVDETNEQYPAPGTIARILAANRDPYQLWQTVVLWHALRVLGRESPMPEGWEQAVGWTAANPAKADELLTECDRDLEGSKQTLLVLFDALDRLSDQNKWDDVRSLTLAALRFGLRCRSRRAVRLKFFLRPDLDEDQEIWKFPDSSKLRHAKVELTWRRSDLYALILTHLVNSTSIGGELRQQILEDAGAGCRKTNDVYVLPDVLLADEKILRRIVESLVDPYMGSDKKRGYTYTWVPTHLSDAALRVSPRSYMLAFRRAAESTAAKYPGHSLPLHYSGIQEGVVIASEIRVREITEDYPWVEPLLAAARGLVVPCTPGELTRRWKPDCLDRMSAASKQKLPPKRYTTDPFRQGKPDALVDDLVELAVLYRTEDGLKVNMPDVFRVGFGIRRRGGVKPPR